MFTHRTTVRNPHATHKHERARSGPAETEVTVDDGGQVPYTTSSARSRATEKGHRADRRRPEALRLLEHVRGRHRVRSPTRRSPSARTWSTCSRCSAPRARREWRTCAHDEFALVHGRRGRGRAGEARRSRGAGRQGGLGRASRASRRARRWAGSSLGRGHMALLPANAAYRFRAERPGVILLQTIGGRRHRRALGRDLPVLSSPNAERGDHDDDHRQRTVEASRSRTHERLPRVHARRVHASAATSTSPTSPGRPAAT